MITSVLFIIDPNYENLIKKEYKIYLNEVFDLINKCIDTLYVNDIYPDYYICLKAENEQEGTFEPIIITNFKLKQKPTGWDEMMWKYMIPAHVSRKYLRTIGFYPNNEMIGSGTRKKSCNLNNRNSNRKKSNRKKSNRKKSNKRNSNKKMKNKNQ